MAFGLSGDSIPILGIVNLFLGSSEAAPSHRLFLGRAGTCALDARTGARDDALEARGGV